MLERIVAILLALAVLAGHAANRSFPVRWLLLCILRRAEAVAVFLCEEATGCEWPCEQDRAGTGNSPADAILMAARLRMLAAFLAALLPDPARHRGRSRGLRDDAAGLPGPLPVLLFVFSGGRQAAGPHDTS